MALPKPLKVTRRQNVQPLCLGMEVKSLSADIEVKK